MARTRVYQHYCPIARSLEVIGEKWSLLIVRDLLDGPQRFSDLLRSLGGITPKWLTLRLRDLEEAGIVERDSEAGRREVWYRLSPKGAELAPVVESLGTWGIHHAMRPPLPGEPLNPGRVTGAVVMYLNQRSVRPARPITWCVRFADGRAYTVRFADRWSIQRGESPADVTVDTSPEQWVAYLMAAPEDRVNLVGSLAVQGQAAAVQEFVDLCGYQLACL